MGIIAGIFLLIVLLFGIMIFVTFFGDAIQNWQNQLESLEKERASVQNPPPNESGPIKTGDVLCNLKLNLVGSISGQYFNNDIEFHHGSFQTEPSVFFNTLDHDPSVIKYKWYCPEGPNKASLLDYMSLFGEIKLEEMSLALANVNAERDAGATIKYWWHVIGTNQDTGETMTGKLRTSDPDAQRVSEFFKSGILRQGTPLPSSYNVEITIIDVIEADYDLEFWNPDWEVNDRSPNFHFNYAVCKSGNYNEALKRCN